MHRPVVALVVALTTLAACGGDPPVVRNVDAAGAGVRSDLSGVGASADAPESSDPPTTAAFSAEARVLAGTPDLLNGFFAALQSGDMASATRYTSGPALQFLQTLSKTTECGLGIQHASMTAPTDVTIGAKGEYRLNATSQITFSTGVTQTFDTLSVQEEDNGSWRLYDLRIGDASVSTLVTTPLPPELEFDKLRMLLVDACFAPDRVTGTVDLESGSDFKTQFVDAFLRLPDGQVVRPPAGALGTLVEGIPAHATRRWSFDFQHPAMGGLATIVLVTLDTEGKSIGQPRERLYPIKMSPIFADVVSS